MKANGLIASRNEATMKPRAVECQVSVLDEQYLDDTNQFDQSGKSIADVVR